MFFLLLKDLSAELLRGFVECLESEEPEGMIEVADEFVGEIRFEFLKEMFVIDCWLFNVLCKELYNLN